MASRSALFAVLVAFVGFLRCDGLVLPMKAHSTAYVRDAHSRRLAVVNLSNDQKNGFSYSCSFEYGKGKRADFLVDTGSSDIWATKLAKAEPSDFSSFGPDCCSAKTCCTPSKPCNSGTTTDKCSFFIQYGSGPTRGTIGISTLTMAGTKIDQLQMGLADSSPSETVQAIMGLAFPTLATYTAPVVSDIFKTFTFQFNPLGSATSGNNLLLGEDANAPLPANTEWKKLPVLLTQSGQIGHWTVGVQSLKVGEQEVLPTPTSGIIDSGTSLLIVPSNLYTPFITALTGNSTDCRNDLQSGFYVCQSLANLKSFTLSLGSLNSVTAFTLGPSSYTWQTRGGFLILIGEGSRPADQWIMGLTFMRAYPFTKFDRSGPAPEISVACPSGGCTSAPPAKGGALAGLETSSSQPWDFQKIAIYIGAGVGGLVVVTLLVMAVIRVAKRRKASQYAKRNQQLFYEARTPPHGLGLQYPQAGPGGFGDYGSQAMSGSFHPLAPNPQAPLYAQHHYQRQNTVEPLPSREPMVRI